jgi:hypothetical protein
MLLQGVFDRLVEKSPVTLMFRALLENALAPADVDKLFFRLAHTGYQQKLLFSQVVDMTGLVVARIKPGVCAAYRSMEDQLCVRIDSVYDKLQRIEPQVGAGLVQHVARKLSPVIDHMEGAGLPPIFPGYRTRILDGKQLDGTQHRLKPLRKFLAAARPGQALVVLDPERMLVCDVVPCEDAYTQERALVDQILARVQPKEVWIADRNFCTTRFLFGLADCQAYFVVRKHASTLRVLRRGRWINAGRTDTGVVSHATWTIGDGEGRTMKIRAVRVQLDQPTRDGETEITVLTNLPPEVSPLAIAEGYRRRWTVETALGEIAATLEAELNTLGYPKASLFCFCVGLVAYNILSTIKASLRAAHGAEHVEEKVSSYYLALEVRSKYEGTEFVADDRHWEASFASLSPRQLADLLVELARGVKLKRFPRSPRGPKKKPPPKLNYSRYRHLSTARLLTGKDPFQGKRPRGKMKPKPKSANEC